MPSPRVNPKLPALHSLDLHDLVRASEATSAGWPEPTDYLAGPHLSHRLRATEYPGDRVEHFEFDPGSTRERLKKVTFVDGRVTHYTGEPGSERYYLKEYPGAERVHFDGASGSEHYYRIERPDGSKEHYDGGRGSEHLYRIEHPNGTKVHYDGERGSEHFYLVERPDGQKDFFMGQKDHETLRLSFHSSGIVLYDASDSAWEREQRVALAEEALRRERAALAAEGLRRGAMSYSELDDYSPSDSGSESEDEDALSNAADAALASEAFRPTSPRYYPDGDPL